MSLFHLPSWVIKKIDHLRRYFLWSGPDIDRPTCKLVCWKILCRPRNQGGWGILDLDIFKQALLGKWWWKFMMDTSWCESKVIQFNYRLSSWNLFPRPSGRMFFFWKRVISGLPAVRGSLIHDIGSGEETSFWKDPWINGTAP